MNADSKNTTTTVTLTEEEMSVTMAALDLAVKQGGLNSASKILPLAIKFSEASTATGDV